MAFLLSRTQDGIDQRINLDEDEVVIGRHPDCSIVIDDPSVSRRHARITEKNGKYLLEDLRSRNGTYLNRRMIQQSTRLLRGDQIGICDALFTFFEDESLDGKHRERTAENPLSNAFLDSSVLVEDGADSSDLSSIMSQMDLSSNFREAVASPEARLNALMEITRALGTAIALDKVLPRVLDCLFDLFTQADRGFIVMVDERGELKPLAMKLRRETDEGTIRISRTIVRHVLDKRQAIISTDAAADSRFDLAQSIADFRIRSMMCAPLFDARNQSVGVIQLDSLSNSVSFRNEDMDVLATVALQAGSAIEKAKLYQVELDEKDRLRDLEVAREIQRRLLPNDAPEFDEYEVFDYYNPALQVGGDYYDYIWLDDDRLAIVVGDVVGHGIAAALLMAKLSAEVKFALAMHRSPVASMNQLNRAISNLNLGRFITLVLTLVDRRTNELTIVNAGHLPPVVRKRSGEAQALSTARSGLPLGIDGDLEYEEFTITLDPGDMVILYTDGVNEAQNKQGELFGHPRIIDQLAEKNWRSAADFGRSLITAVTQHVEGEPQGDDVCMVCFRRLPDSDSETGTAKSTSRPQGVVGG
jgi:serine phosphatase RsbU (regulator of sigma subunit)/pSer/pThr/pTyr-binding forkhead associated (FHA) protein